MSVRTFILLIVTWSTVASCNTEFFPEGLYDYQAERLLAGDTSKVWTSNGSGFLLFVSDQDSLMVIWIAENPIDTNLLGTANAASFEEQILFNDTLLFSSGEKWRITSLSSQVFELDADTLSGTYSLLE